VPSQPGAGDLRRSIESFDRAFAQGRLEEFLSFFADDARLLIHQQDEVAGTEAIRASFDEVFRSFDTSAYETRYDVVDEHGDRAYVLASFDEVLRPREGAAGLRIHGRTVQFWGRQADGAWRISVLLTARSAPDEPEG